MREVWEGTGPILVASHCDASATFTGAAIDSRSVQPGDLFFALHGESQDGHDFVDDAVAHGAAGVVADRPIEPSGVSVFHTSDSLTALHRIAAQQRRRHDVRVIGVTGSVGKTTCKEIVASVLGRNYRVLKSESNYNTDIGIALTLLRLTSDHERAVLEMAMYGRGEVALLAEMTAPHVGIVTNIGPVHLERVGWMGGIVEAKAELVEALPSDGLAVLNGDDARTAALAQRTRARTVLFGKSEQCTVRGRDVQSHGLDGISFRIEANGESVAVSCPLPGKHHVYPALAATAVALNEGMSLREIADALADVKLEQRLNVTPGPNGSTIIDDSYNASPAAMLAALDLLSELDGRRIAVLGDMRELGAAEEEGHRAVGSHAAECCDVLFVIGENASITSAAAREAGHTDVRILESDDDAAKELRAELRDGDYALIKASRALGLEKLVKALVTQ
ncbi:MAG: UDP-N-acetylmuramoyl-tripeptide--D-alanyl-D-alanine ligase [Chloroflexi bacterium]|nr:UDP-N-acetylmuramoyl-tripeptide--D-alanyl-D-alanine ligase [Chloroflexota bacterium]